MLTFPQLKQAIDNTMSAYGITEDQAKLKLFGLDDTTLLAVAAGDLSILDNTANNMSTGEKITGDKINDLEKITEPVKRSRGKKTSKQNTTSPATLQTEPVKNQLEKVAGEIVPDNSGLPDGLADTIFSAVDTFCKKHDFENMSKCRQTAWSACCQFIGQTIFKPNRKILSGHPPKTGGFCYDTDKLSSLADLWGHMCGVYGKAPFVDDFANFAGLEESSIYTTHSRTGGEITLARMQLLQKLHGMQEKGIAGLIVDGRQNPTGALAVLNHWHGWTSTKEIIHTTSGGAQNAVALPVFDNSMSSLPDNSLKS